MGVTLCGKGGLADIILRCELILYDLDGPEVSHKGPHKKKAGDQSGNWRAVATGQGMLAISRSGKRQGTASPLESSRGTSPVDMLI